MKKKQLKTVVATMEPLLKSRWAVYVGGKENNQVDSFMVQSVSPIIYKSKNFWKSNSEQEWGYEPIVITFLEAFAGENTTSLALFRVLEKYKNKDPLDLLKITVVDMDGPGVPLLETTIEVKQFIIQFSGRDYGSDDLMEHKLILFPSTIKMEVAKK